MQDLDNTAWFILGLHNVYINIYVTKITCFDIGICGRHPYQVKPGASYGIIQPLPSACLAVIIATADDVAVRFRGIHQRLIWQSTPQLSMFKIHVCWNATLKLKPHFQKPVIWLIIALLDWLPTGPTIWAFRSIFFHYAYNNLGWCRDKITYIVPVGNVLLSAYLMYRCHSYYHVFRLFVFVLPCIGIPKSNYIQITKQMLPERCNRL